MQILFGGGEVKKNNEKIVISGEEALFVLSEIEYLLISLRNIGRYYHDDSIGVIGDNELAYCRETVRFIDENGVTRRLAKVREIISSKFDDALGDDDMDDIERAVEGMKVWESPGD
ncbi:hypothetical protein [Burkholderia diffusa]|uniref:hypothetical protein n=1 Tax=Burkholderia diffusa TaxID=488732 RepID=UPI0019397F56|nr:hypothetical protein [Burkholderia diffusa]MBM2656972.1 hypothetical protein [Burkholderia diffusa]